MKLKNNLSVRGVLTVRNVASSTNTASLQEVTGGSALSSTGTLTLSSNSADYIKLDGGYTNITKPVILTASDVGTTSEYTGLYIQTDQSLTATSSTSAVYGASITGFLSTGAFNNTSSYGVVGLNVYSAISGNTGTTVANARGVRSLVTEQSNGTVTNGIGYDSEFYGNFTNFYGFRQRPISWGTVTNAYGFYSEIPDSATSYNFYAAGTAKNYFAGNVGIGTANPAYTLDVKTTSANARIGNTSNDTLPAILYLSNLRTDGVATPTNSYLGSIFFSGSTTSGTDSYGAYISSKATSNASTRVPATLEFYTAPDDVTYPTLKMIIMPNGTVGIGKSSPSAPLHISTTTSNTNGITTGLILERQSTGTVSGYYGSQITYNLENSANTVVEAAGIIGSWVDATSGSERGKLEITVRRGGTNMAAAVFGYDTTYGAYNLYVDTITTYGGQVQDLSFFSTNGTSGVPSANIKSNPTTTNTIDRSLRVSRFVSGAGTPAVGIGAGLDFEIETSTTNSEIGAAIDVVSTDLTAGSEDFDISIKTMAAGATAAERVRITSVGNVGIGTSDPFTNLHVKSTSNTTILIESSQTTGSTTQSALLNFRAYEGATGNEGRIFITGVNTTTFGGANRFVIQNVSASGQIAAYIGTTEIAEILSNGISVNGSVTATSFVGNASSATKLATARLINGVSFDGTEDITIPGSSALTAINDKTANYTLVVADAGKLIQSTSTGAITITVPDNATAAIPIGSIVYLAQDNTGSVTISGAAGVTLKIPTGYQGVIAGRHSMVSLIKIATNTWRLVGDLLVA